MTFVPRSLVVPPKVIKVNVSMADPRVHSWEGTCHLQLGNPSSSNYGIRIEIDVAVAGPCELKFVQNTQYLRVRIGTNFGKMCADSKGQWELDGGDPYQGHFLVARRAGTPTVVAKDSPSQSLEVSDFIETLEIHDKFRALLERS